MSVFYSFQLLAKQEKYTMDPGVSDSNLLKTKVFPGKLGLEPLVNVLICK